MFFLLFSTIFDQNFHITSVRSIAIENLHNSPGELSNFVQKLYQESDLNTRALTLIQFFTVPKPKNIFTGIKNDTILALLTPVGTNHYRISSYSFRGNYSFLNLKIVKNSNRCRNFNFLPNKLNFCCGN